MDRSSGLRSGLTPSVPGPRIRRPGADANAASRRGSATSTRSSRTRRTPPLDTDTPPPADDNP